MGPKSLPHSGADTETGAFPGWSTAIASGQVFNPRSAEEAVYDFLANREISRWTRAVQSVHIWMPLEKSTAHLGSSLRKISMKSIARGTPAFNQRAGAGLSTSRSF